MSKYIKHNTYLDSIQERERRVKQKEQKKGRKKLHKQFQINFVKMLKVTSMFVRLILIVMTRFVR